MTVWYAMDTFEAGHIPGPRWQAGPYQGWTEALALCFLCGIAHLVRWPQGVSEKPEQKAVLSFQEHTHGMLCCRGLHLLKPEPYSATLSTMHTLQGLETQNYYLTETKTSNKLYLWKQYQCKSYIQIKPKKKCRAVGALNNTFVS